MSKETIQKLQLYVELHLSCSLKLHCQDHLQNRKNISRFFPVFPFFDKIFWLKNLPIQKNYLSTKISYKLVIKLIMTYFKSSGERV